MKIPILNAHLTGISENSEPHINASRTMNAFAKLHSGSPLRVLVMGDSVVEGVMIPALGAVANAVGYSGRMHSEDFYATSTTGAAVAFSDFLPLRSLGYEIDNTEYVIYSAGGSMTHAVGDTVKVTYRRASGTGNFKIQARADLGAWVDQGAEISTANATADMTTATRTLSSLGPWQIRILGTSGTCGVSPHVELSRAAGPGVVEMSLVISGGTMSEFTGSTTALRRGYLAGVAPDIIFLRWYDSGLGADIISLKADLVALGLDDTTDIVVLGVSQSSTVDDPDLLAELAELRDAAVTQDVGLIDLYFGYNNRFLTDAVHMDATGYAWSASEALRQLGWLDIPAVKLANKHIASRTTLGTLPDSTTLSDDDQLKLYLSAGTWRVRGQIIWTAEGTGQGFKASATFVGTNTLTALLTYYGPHAEATGVMVQHPAQPGAAETLPRQVMTIADTAQNGSGAFEFIVVAISHGVLGISRAKNTTGSTGYIREGSFIEATLLT